MSFKLNKEEGKINPDEDYQSIQPQPLSLLLQKEDRIDIFKLNQMAMNPRNQSCEAPDGISLSEVTYDIQSAGSLLAMSSDRDRVLLFEAKGKGSTFGCSFKK